MADPLSISTGIVGVISFAFTAAEGLHNAIQSIKDAPKDIAELRLDLKDLTAILSAAKALCQKREYRNEETILAETLSETVRQCTQSCNVCVEEIHRELQPLIQSGRRSPFKAIAWLRVKGDVGRLRERLDERKASLSLAVVVLSSFLAGKDFEEIKKEIATGCERLEARFKESVQPKRFRTQLESNIDTLSERNTEVADTRSATYANIHDYFRRMEEDPPLSPEPGSLVEAIRTGKVQILQDLIHRGVSLAERSIEGMTALHHCAIYNDTSLAALLLDSGADINARDDSMRTPLELALDLRSTKAASLLIERGASLWGCSSQALLEPIKTTENEVTTQVYIEALKSRLNKPKASPSLLHDSIHQKEPQFLEMLLKGGFDPNLKDAYDLEPIYISVLRCNYQCVKILARYGANIDAYLGNTKNDLLHDNIEWQKPLFASDDCTPLLIAGASFPADMTKLLVQLGANVNFVYPASGNQGLIRRCHVHFFEVAKTYIEAGADVNYPGSERGRRPMHWAVSCQNEPLVRLLISKNADLNCTSNDTDNAMTPLHMAVEAAAPSLAKILVESGARLDIRNRDGFTPLELARELKREGFNHILAAQTA